MPGLAVSGRDFHSDKMTLHIFNPENDMALADGGSGYTAPATIRQMRDELHWLPLWWAKDDDLVWNGEDRITLSEGDEIRPWGWSAALVHQLKQAGMRSSFPRPTNWTRCAGSRTARRPWRLWHSAARRVCWARDWQERAYSATLRRR